MNVDSTRPSSRRDRRTPASRLVDVGATGVATQSSDYLPQFAAVGAITGDFGLDFTTHTQEEQSPWWQVDLRAWYRVEQIVIRNRRDPRFRARAKSLRVEASDNGSQWTLLHSGTTFFGTDDEMCLRVPLSGQLPVRYIRISLSERAALHLNRVQVFVDRKELESRRLLESFGFDFGNSPRWGDGAARSDSYRVTGIGADGDACSSGLRIIRLGRFANNVIQQAQAIRVATNLGMDFVYMLDSGLFRFGEEASADKVKLLPQGAPLRVDAVTVEGDFFYRDRLGSALGREFMFSAGLVADTRKWLAPYLNLPEAPSPVTHDELLVHVRSGDLFGDHPHPAYGQPPLAFYEAAVDRAMTLGFTRVRVIAEDRLNPVVDALESYLQKGGVPHSMQLGHSLNVDLATLLAGRGLVFGRGTFGLAVCMLSTQVRVVFEGSGSRHYRNMFQDLDLLASADISKERYSPFDRWIASESQQLEMLHYPRSGVRFGERFLTN